MPRQRAPGVYFEPTDPTLRRLDEVRTDIAGFVGIAERGPLNKPLKIESWTQFITRFGEPMAEGFLAYAVSGFFANGGRTCWVVRAGARTEGRHASLLLTNAEGDAVFRVRARDLGPATEQIAVRVEAAAGGRFSLFVQVRGQTQEVWRDLTPTKPDDADRRLRDRYAVEVVNGGRKSEQPPEYGPDAANLGSVLIELEDLASDMAARAKMPVSVKPRQRPQGNVFWHNATGFGIEYRNVQAAGPRRNEGFLGQEERAVRVLDNLSVDHLTGENQPPDPPRGLRALENIDEVALVAIPDLFWPGHLSPAPPASTPPRCHVLPTKPPLPTCAPLVEERPTFSPHDAKRGQEALLRHCAVLRDRFAILDTPAQLTPERAIDWVQKQGGLDLRSEAGQFGAVYYPWLYVPEPRPGPNVRLVPPSGHVAGVYARVDRSVGVQKPPANELLEEVRGLELDIDAEAHGLLNDEMLNTLRAYPGRGCRVAGARTLVPPQAAELRPWRFVHVRRLLLMIEETLDQSTQWLVFESNQPERWRDLDRVVRTFLRTQWERGRLDGATPEEAFQVTCDETTNVPFNVAQGQMLCEIRVLPPQPAEFVVIRLGRREGETGVRALPS